MERRRRGLSPPATVPGYGYGAGIFILADKTLVHNGSFEGFKSMFSVSPDRRGGRPLQPRRKKAGYLD